MLQRLHRLGKLGLAAALAAPGVRAESVFDVGAAGSAVRVECAGELLSSETYPAWAFGHWYPEGTLMAASLETGACADWPNVPDECIAVFIAELHPAVDCGCNFSGVLDQPTALELHYDRALVRDLGTSEESLRLYAFGIQGPVWTAVENARVDPASQTVFAQATGFVMGLRWYAIAGPPAISAVRPVSWSTARILYR